MIQFLKRFFFLTKFSESKLLLKKLYVRLMNDLKKIINERNIWIIINKELLFRKKLIRLNKEKKFHEDEENRFERKKE